MALDRKAEVVKDRDMAWLNQPVEAILDNLCAKLDRLWQAFDRELRLGKLSHLDYDPQRKSLTWRRPKADKEEARQSRAAGTEHGEHQDLWGVRGRTG